jgi:hypothetical protein
MNKVSAPTGPLTQGQAGSQSSARLPIWFFSSQKRSHVGNEITYTYDGDGRGFCIPERSERGNMVKSVIGEVTSYYVGSYYEKKVRGSEQNERKTYFAGTTRIAKHPLGGSTWTKTTP